jgi:hypothetical protein
MKGPTCSLLFSVLVVVAGSAFAGSFDSIYRSRSGRVYEIVSGEARILGGNSQTIGRFDSRKIIVRLEAEKALSEAAVSGAGVVGASVQERRYGAGRYAAVRLSGESDPLASLQAIESLPGVEYAYFDRLVTLLSEPNDPLFSEQWGLADTITGVPTAWEIEEGGEEVLIALMAHRLRVRSGGPYEEHRSCKAVVGDQRIH